MIRIIIDRNFKSICCRTGFNIDIFFGYLNYLFALFIMTQLSVSQQLNKRNQIHSQTLSVTFTYHLRCATYIWHQEAHCMKIHVQSNAQHITNRLYIFCIHILQRFQLNRKDQMKEFVVCVFSLAQAGRALVLSLLLSI